VITFRVLDARTVMDPQLFETLPSEEVEVIAINILGLPSVPLQEIGEREVEWLCWLHRRTSAEHVVYKVKASDPQGKSCTLCVLWPPSTMTDDTSKYVHEVEALVMSLAPQIALFGYSRVPARGPVIHIQGEDMVHNMPLFIQLIFDASQLHTTSMRTKTVEGVRYKVKVLPDASMRVLADRIDEAELPLFLEQLLWCFGAL
jgi:hypothetical protein